MKNYWKPLLAAATISLAATPALALVGVSQPGGTLSRHSVMVLKASRNGAGNCTGVVIAPRVILTAGHCVTSAIDIAVYVSPQSTPTPIKARAIAVHPGYVRNAIQRRVRSIDLAMIQTEDTLPAQLVPVTLDSLGGIQLGQAFLIAGFGLTSETGSSLSGELRAGRLSARAPLSSILLWSGDPDKRGFGACTGDSGGPIFNGDGTQLVAITVWSTGQNGRKCGDLTQGILVAPQRDWIEKTLLQWNVR